VKVGCETGAFHLVALRAFYLPGGRTADALGVMLWRFSRFVFLFQEDKK
jgi:hypothetical protein